MDHEEFSRWELIAAAIGAIFLIVVLVKFFWVEGT